MNSASMTQRVINSTLLQSIALYCVIAITILMQSGCGEASVPTGTVTGTVTFSGNPYGNVRLILLSMESGKAGTADVDAAGSFEMSDALPVGEYVAYLAPIPPDTAAEQPAPEVIDENIPDGYWNESTSKLRVKIDEGENQVGLVIE